MALGQWDSNRQTLALRIEAVEADLGKWEAKIVQAHARISEFERQKAEFQRLQSHHERLQHTLQNVDVNKNIDQETVSVMDRAAVFPTRRRVPLKLVLAALVGVTLGLGAVLFLAQSDDRFLSTNELKQLIPEKVIGHVPEMVADHGAGLKLLEADDERHLFAESFRMIRSSLLFLSSCGSQLKTILVTSAIPGEGKSTATVNLAAALAFGGSRVLLVDADLRRGILHRLVGSENTTGLTDALRQDGDMEKSIVATSIPNLDLLPRGSLLRAPNDLLLGSGMKDLLRELGARYDYVLLDSPPVFAGADTVTLAPQVDGVIFVVRGAFTRASVARQALELVAERKARSIGIVFNRASRSECEYPFYKYAEAYASPTALSV